jgi:predicted nucleic acid-binding Zn ribbon protein
MPRYDFKCDHCGTVQEAITGYDVQYITCKEKECGTEDSEYLARRQLCFPAVIAIH